MQIPLSLHRSSARVHPPYYKITALILLGPCGSPVRAHPSTGRDENRTRSRPYGQDGAFVLLKNWTFGAHRAQFDGSQTGPDLDQSFLLSLHLRRRANSTEFRLTGLTIIATTPDGDAHSLHVFRRQYALRSRAVFLRAEAYWPRGIESGILRAKLPISPGMYIEMRAKTSARCGRMAPRFWLNAGVQFDNGKFLRFAVATGDRHLRVLQLAKARPGLA